MTFDAISLDILSITFVYMILSLQVSTGFPPFYLSSKRQSYSLMEQKRHQVRTSLKAIGPYFVALIVSMLCFGFTQYSMFKLIASIFAILIGFDRRKQVKTHIGKPQDWVLDLSPFTNMFIARYPMGIYDLWILGIMTIFALIVFLSGS